MKHWKLRDEEKGKQKIKDIAVAQLAAMSAAEKQTFSHYGSWKAKVLIWQLKNKSSNIMAAEKQKF